MKLIGTITQVQIQQSPLKTGEDTSRMYSPAPILRPDAIRLTPQGVIGLVADGEDTIDVHHIAHPQTRNNKNANGISLGFTSSYDRMQARFGEHLQYGVAGENILITPTEDFNIEDLHTDLMIETSSGWVRLGELMIAAPCNPFSQFCAGQPINGEELKETLQFLADGTRGFYATLGTIHPDEPIIRAGDRVYAVLEGETLD